LLQTEENKLIMKVDAVITWVNSNDKKWQEKINKYKDVKIDFDDKRNSVRFNSIGEIDIAIKSIIKFAPFIRTIFLVTDHQKPDSFDDLKILANANNINLALIDHKIIFKDYLDYLPCFNSCSIGSMLFKVPDLSEHFIIFNDDTFLMRETKVSDFFIDGKPIIRGKWQPFNENRSLRNFYIDLRSKLGIPKKRNKISFKKFQQSSAKLAQTESYVRRFHTPVCVRKSTLEEFFQGNNLLEKNIKHRFRNENQFIVSSLSEHLEIKNKSYHFRENTQLTYFRSYKSHFIVKLKLNWFSKNTKKLFMTFQSLELADQKIINYVLNWIDKRINN
jgi:hypothetical protein